MNEPNNIKNGLPGASETATPINGKPLQTLSFVDKMKDDCEWGKNTQRYYLKRANFDDLGIMDHDNPIRFKHQLYDAYNNRIPQQLFEYVTNPTASKSEKFKTYPGKIRPYNILRPNIDLFVGEWEKRPFNFDVVNVDGDEAFNSFLFEKENTYKDNLTQRFVNELNKLGYGTNQDSQEIPDPKTVITELNLNYKDAKAFQGYKALKAMELEMRLREKYRQHMKNWTIAGEMYSLKLPLHGDITYLPLNANQVWADRPFSSPYSEDGEAAVVRFSMSISEIVEFFYDILGESGDERKAAIDKIDYSFGINANNLNILRQLSLTDYVNNLEYKKNVYYTCWKSKKKIGFLEYPDPLTGEVQYDIVDEDYKTDTTIGEKVEWFWVDEAWHGWAIEAGSATDFTFVGTEAIPAQRNQMNGFSSCKLPVNGKKFSDLESKNVSPLWLGMPYQIMYIILLYRLELTIARSRGKVVIMDINTIPDDDGEEGFFWYNETMGYGFINRMQDGVDRSWNQYMVVDFSLFKDIKQLIDIANFYKDQWDELLGINRQRKGQLNSSDGLGVSQQASFRSSVISEIIYIEFEAFLEKELQGLLDISKFAWVDGKKGYYRNSDGRLEMFNIDPDDYVNSDLGIFVENTSTKLDRINLLRQQINAIAQRKDVKTSTIIDLVMSDSITEMKALARRAEAIEAETIRKSQQSEAEREKDLEQLKRDYDIFEKILDTQFMNAEQDRLDNREYIKGEIAAMAKTGSDVDVVAVEKNAIERLDRMTKAGLEQQRIRLEQQWQKIEREKIASNEKIARDNNRTKLANKVTGEK